METKLTIKRCPTGKWVMVNEAGEFIRYNLTGFTSDLDDAYQFEEAHVEACFEWAQIQGYPVEIERE